MSVANTPPVAPVNVAPVITSYHVPDATTSNIACTYKSLIPVAGGNDGMGWSSVYLSNHAGITTPPQPVVSYASNGLHTTSSAPDTTFHKRSKISIPTIPPDTFFKYLFHPFNFVVFGDTV